MSIIIIIVKLFSVTSFFSFFYLQCRDGFEDVKPPKSPLAGMIVEFLTHQGTNHDISLCERVDSELILCLNLEAYC